MLADSLFYWGAVEVAGAAPSPAVGGDEPEGDEPWPVATPPTAAEPSAGPLFDEVTGALSPESAGLMPVLGSALALTGGELVAAGVEGATDGVGAAGLGSQALSTNAIASRTAVCLLGGHRIASSF